MGHDAKPSPVDPIAVVGISCRLPGSANSLDGLWDLLMSGSDAWSTVPLDRWNEGAFYHPNPDNRNGTNHHKGGHFISGDLRDFDHSFFRLSSQQADAMDPQQRILLEMSYEALENAGWPLDRLAGTKTAVHVATFTSDFERNLYKDPLDMPTYYMTGAERAIMSNRLSHAFDLRGPSMTVDTACSGGLVSLHQACLGLLDGGSDAAIVAAANLILSPDHHIGMSNLHLISGTGRSYPFDQRGTGYGRGEGCVVLVVKRLDKALADRDPVRAVICSTAVNQNGYSANGIMHPNGKAQLELIRTAYERAGLSPQDVTYVEAHGTGTVAGDHEELGAIAEAFIGLGRPLPLYVGSNKGNIGHTESTSGLASIVKAALILDRQVIPPVAGFEKPKTGLPLESIRIPVKPVPLPQLENIPSRVSINSFGFGGTNAHAILERGIQRPHEATGASCEASHRLFILSANSQRSLAGLLAAYRDWLEKNPGVDLASFSYTLCHRRTRLPWRFSCVARDVKALKENIHSRLDMLNSISVSASKTCQIFVFTGQGAQWLGMGRELLLKSCTSSVFRDSIRVSRDILSELGATWNLEEELLCEDAEHSLLGTAELAQPATTALQIALASLLEAQGVRPNVVVGHSSGEIAAAFAAGYLTHQTALAIAYHRGFMGALSRSRSAVQGSMMSVGLGEEEVAPYLKELTRGYATIACVNSPKSVTISGDADAIEELASRLKSTGGVFFRRLLIDTAYHSDHMRLVAGEYENCIRNLEASPAHKHVTFVSSVTGRVKSSGFDSAYWVTNLVSPVRFYNAIKTIIGHQFLSRGSSTRPLFIEIGPYASLAGVVRQSLETVPTAKHKFEYTSVLQRKLGAVASALALAGYLYERGVDVDFAAVSNLAPGLDTASVLTNLPAYTWDHSVKHWHESRMSRDYRLRRAPYHDLLGVRIEDSTSIEPRWRHIVDLTTLSWLADHVIDGLVVFPGSGYLCMVFEAILQLSRALNPKRPLESIVVRNVAFLRAFVVPDAPKRTEMQLSLKPTGGGQLNFQFLIAVLSDDKWYEHCSGTVEGVLSDGHDELDGPNNLACTDVESSTPLHGKSVTEEELYAQLEASGNKYGPSFRGCKSLKFVLDTLDATAEVEIPDIATVMPAGHQEPHLIHPSTLDIIFHPSLPLVKKSTGAGSVVPVHIDELSILGPAAMPQDPGARMKVMTSLTSSHLRTSYADFHVEADSTPVLSITGMEMRNMGPTSDQSSSTAKLKKICYTLDWKVDMDFARSEDFSSHPDLSRLIDYICFKCADISIVEFRGDFEDLSSVVLPMVDSHGGSVSSYTCIESKQGTGVHQTTHRGPVDTRVRFKTADEDFQQQSCTVALVTAIEKLKHACSIVEPDGIVLMMLKNHQDLPQDMIGTIDQEVSGALRVQLKFFDVVRGRLVIVLRRNDILENRSLPRTLRILTHSPIHSTPSWVTKLASKLNACFDSVTHDHVTADRVNNAHPEVCFLVVDDCPEPILSDKSCFGAVIELLKQPARILWLCPDNPPQMYQIAGFSRTAHAENSELRLITAHAAIDMLKKDETQNPRLANFLVNRLGRLAAGDDELQPEREFLIRGDGTVLVPRLHHSEILDEVVAGDNARRSKELQMCRFGAASRTLMVSSDSAVVSTDVPVAFIEDQIAGVSGLAEDEMEVEARAIGLTDDFRTASFCQYAGVVTRVGSAVSRFGPGDRVVGIGTSVGDSCPRISQHHALHLPAEVPFTEAAALLFDVLAACYALCTLNHLSPSDHVLVHGALTPAGRAVVAAAQIVGAHISVLASDTAEFHQVRHQLDIPAEQILEGWISLKRRPWRNTCRGRFDVIIQATEKSIPSGVLSQLNELGSLIFVQTPPRLTEMPRELNNTTIHAFSITNILRSNPSSVAGLIAEASPIFKSLPTDGLVFAARDVAQVSEAVRLLDTRIHSRIVLSAKEDSMAPCIVPVCTSESDWQRNDVSYLIAGGLGDLGRRLLVLMASRGAQHLVTISRRVVRVDEHKDLQMQLDKICPGCRLYCLSGDVTSEEDMKKAAASFAEMGIPSVAGIIQSAVILQDRTLDSMTHDDFLVASRIKVDGTLTLERTFASPHLVFIMTLSSASTIVGTSGQGNYNAGNTVQDAMPHTRRDTPYHFMSLNIGWIEDAIATADNESRQHGLSRGGLRSIQPEELSRYLDHALGTALGKVRSPQTVIGFDAASLSQASDFSKNGNIHSAMFRHVYVPVVAGSTSSAPGLVSFKEVAASGDRESLVELIANSVTSKLTQLISIDAIRIHKESRSILELGLDSLVAIELRNWITQEFHAPLQSSEIILEQTIRTLAEKVASRSQLIQRHEDGTSKALSNQAATPTEKLDWNESSGSLPTILPQAPLPTHDHTLQLFQDSRVAIDTKTEQTCLAVAVSSFMRDGGPALQQQLERAAPDLIAKNYERQIYFERREPLQDYSTFSIVHPIDAPTHTQAMRAALVTIAGLTFIQNLAAERHTPDSAHGIGVRREALDWMFYTARQPGIGVDHVARFPASKTVAVLRRGHVFQLMLVDAVESLSVASMCKAYSDIINASEESKESMCVLTADERNSWASLRDELEHDQANSILLSAVEGGAFVVCLDDESPSTAGERHTQYLLNGIDRPLANRWLDKPVQFAVTANGLSAGIHEHTKLDGLDVGSLHRHIVKTLMSSSQHADGEITRLPPDGKADQPSPYPSRELVWTLGPAAKRRIDYLQTTFASPTSPYQALGYEHAKCAGLGRASLRGRGASPNSVAHLTAVLAVFLVDGSVRPVWEVVSLARFARGRIDWVQTMSPAMREFVEAAAGAVNTDEQDGAAKSRLRLLFHAAARSYSRAVANAAQGTGYVTHLYALRGLAQQSKPDDLPALFQTSAWNATRRGGAGQDLKIGFMPSDEEGGNDNAWYQEGGFLMHGDRGVYIHCGVSENEANFYISARRQYASDVYLALQRASNMVSGLLNSNTTKIQSSGL
ncbi:polyketide synthase [Hypoxylon sp. NC1633]|nr:polyketide synthase [Hypoxylon sp. NC1633]